MKIKKIKMPKLHEEYAQFGFTQVELAAASGVNERTIRRLEDGRWGNSQSAARLQLGLNELLAAAGREPFSFTIVRHVDVSYPKGVTAGAAAARRRAGAKKAAEAHKAKLGDPGSAE